MSAGAEIRIEEVDVEVVRPLRQKHLRPDRPIEDVVYRSDADPTARHFVARSAEGEVVGISSLHMEDRHAGKEPYHNPGMRVRGMAVEDEWRGRKVGRALLEHMLAIGRKQGVREAWGNARVANRGFYERSGFRAASREFDLPGIGRHLVMVRDLEEKGRRSKRLRAMKESDLQGDPAVDEV